LLSRLLPRPCVCLGTGLSLLLLTGCDTRSPTEIEKQYYQALATARQQPAAAPVGAGLRLGLDSLHVTHHLDSLRARGELVWSLPHERLVMQAYPTYSAGKLVRLVLKLEADGQPWSSIGNRLEATLTDAYGTSYPFGTSSYHVVRWVYRGMAVELDAVVATGYTITYTDLQRAKLYSLH
jgi:hypothetical protein